MADTKLLAYLEEFITEDRKAKFLEILSRRTNHFTVAIEDVYQAHNTSAVIVAVRCLEYNRPPC